MRISSGDLISRMALMTDGVHITDSFFNGNADILADRLKRVNNILNDTTSPKSGERSTDDSLFPHNTMTMKCQTDPRSHTYKIQHNYPQVVIQSFQFSL